jgi:hypothetical protein
VYVEDTYERDADEDSCGDPECTECPYNFEPRMIVELSSGSQ